MKLNVLTIFPQMFSAVTELGLIGQAVKSGAIEINFINPRDFAEGVHKSVDDRPYGGGDGMVMLADPLIKALESIKSTGDLGYVVYLSPQGRTWSDQKARSLSEVCSEKPLTLICGRYGGIDERFIQNYVDEEISIGDYILTGGEIPAMVLIDSVARLRPGVLGNADSPHKESFSDGLLEAPQFTRPQRVIDQEVPEALRSGDHARIERWRRDISLVRTAVRRPDLLKETHKEELKEAVKRVQKFPPEDLKACGISPEVISHLEV